MGKCGQRNPRIQIPGRRQARREEKTRKGNYPTNNPNLQTEETKEPKVSKKKNIDQMAAERQKKLVLTDTEIKAVEEKYKHLPEKERNQRYIHLVHQARIQEEVEKLLTKYIFAGKMCGNKQV